MYDEIYEWAAYLEDGTCLISSETLFDNLPFDKIIAFKLKPTINGYAPIRVSTHKKPFKYFIKVINELFGELVTKFYIIDCGCIYAIQYPQKKYWCFRNMKEFEERL